MSMSKKRKAFDNEFKNSGTSNTSNEHAELSRAQAAANLGIGQSTLSRWLKEARESDDGKINAPGSGNYPIRRS